MLFPLFPSSWKGQVGYRLSWPREDWASAEEHTVIIKLNSRARPPGRDVAAIQASGSVGLLPREGHRAGRPHQQSVGETENLEIWAEYAFNI